MKKNTKYLLKIASILLFGSLFMLSCEPNADAFGEQFFNENAIQGTQKSYPLVAYNINNNDTIQSDASKLDLVQLGAFNEGVFGMQKASYVTQVRMTTYNPDFANNSVVDSVVMVLKPRYSTDSLTTTTNEDYIYPDGAVAAKKVVNSYPVVKYGKYKIGGNAVSFTIKVHEVTDFLNASTDAVKSNKIVNYSTLLGTKTFNGKISSTTITKDADNATLWTNDTSLRIPLDATFFQNKIIDKEGSTDLKDVAAFIRYFRGIRISVDENDGYLFSFTPNDAKIIIYYKYDKVDNGVTTRPQTNFTLSLGVSNVHIGQYEYNRTDTAVATALASINSTSGDKKLFLQGMGGPGVKIEIPNDVISDLKTKFSNEKIGIISAKIRVYTDEVLWNNNYEKTNSLVFGKENASTFLSDMTTLSSAPNYALIKAYDLDKNPAYYDFTITKTLKDVVETGASNEKLVINIGRFLVNSTTGGLAGYNVTSRAYTPNRLVFVGTDASNNKQIQLQVTYGYK